MSRQMKWMQFFAGLALAEKSAADYCTWIASEFRKRGQLEFAATYETFAREETGHFEMVRSLIDKDITATDQAHEVYAGRLFSDFYCLVERMAVVHLAFEPSALAFLGHLYVNADAYFSEELAEKVRTTFGAIIKEEVAHIHTGKDMIETLLKEETPEIRQKVFRSLRRHKAFLSVGLKSYFREEKDANEFIASMIENYDKRYTDLTASVAGW